MELCEAQHPPIQVAHGVGSRSSRLSGGRQAPSRYLCHWIPLQKSSRITYLGTKNSLLGSQIMSIKKGDSVRSTNREVCKVLWTIEADIADDQLLYITGDPAALGCWESEKAIPLSPCKEQANLWITETEVPCGIHFRYNYFIKQGKQSYCSIFWRPGPEFSLSIPSLNKPNESIMVRDLWVRSRMEIPVHSWGTWLDGMDASTPMEHEWHRLLSLGELETSSSIRTDDSPATPATPATPLFNDLTTKNMNFSEQGMKVDVNDVGQDFAEMEQPVEEPWLLRAVVASEVKSCVTSHLSDHMGVAEYEVSTKLSEDTEKVGTENEYKLIHLGKPVSTVILINSSVCTMQRIAILEDGKLVELLLEPVKNNVQCDSVYLGVVTKLVPHMGGAFVDIGISRPSLMEIKQNREPFVYPPFNKRVHGRELNGHVVAEASEPLDVHEHDFSYSEGSLNGEFLEDEDEDDSIEFINVDAEENEQVDELNVPYDHKTPVINASVNYEDDEGDFEEYYEENGHHMECGSVDDLMPLEAESSNDTELSDLILESLKDSNDAYGDENKWVRVRKGTKVIVQVVKEGLGTKGPALTAYPCLRSRFWVLSARCNRIGVSKKITGVERTRLRVIAKTLQPPGLGLTVRTVAASHSLEELQKDLEGLLSTWKGIVEHAESAALAADEGVEGAVPVLLHRAMAQTLSVVQDYFNEKVNSMVVDSPRTYHEVTNYLQEIAADLCDRVVLYNKRIPIFDEYGIEEEIDSILSKQVPLDNGGSLVIEQTEALVSIDVNGGHSMLGQATSQEKAVLDVNLTAAKQIARELRLRDIGGIIVVDFIDMVDESHKRLVYEEMKKAVERDRSIVKISELSRHGLMEITRKRVRPSVTFMISEPCTCCHATGRVEALETSFSKIEREICRLLAASNQKAEAENAKSWPRFVLRVDRFMFNYLTSGKRTKLAVLSSSLKVWILLKVARGFIRGTFEVRPFTDDRATDEQQVAQQVAISRLRPTEGRSYIPSTKVTLFPVKKWKTSGK